MTPENREREAAFEAWMNDQSLPEGDSEPYVAGWLARASQQAGPQSLPVEAIEQAICLMEVRAAENGEGSIIGDANIEWANALRSLLPKSPDQAQPEEKA